MPSRSPPPEGTTQVQRRAHPAPGPSGRFALLPIAAPDAAARAIAIDRTLVVGRGAGSDVDLAGDTAVSRRHAELSPAPGGVRVEDLGSRNGTFVQACPVRVPVVAPVGSIVRVGGSLFRVAVLEEEWSPATRKGPLAGGVSLAPVRRAVGLVAPTDLPVLILGATGTGKEVVAGLLHAGSGRTGPFVPVNCAALPEALAESELFGHTRGAFTGADRSRQGLFSIAAGGTLFLDEVGELSPAIQAKLLRVLEDGVVRPVGGDASYRVDTRVIAATNRDLAVEVAHGRFRSDLHARLAVLEIRLPPLRDRPEDLPALSAYLLERAGRAAVAFSPDALEAMACYDWPQNVRELDRVLRRVSSRRPSVVELDALPDEIRRVVLYPREPPMDGGAAVPDAVGRARRSAEPGLDREEVQEALRAWRGNVRQAARALGIGRGHFYRLLKRFGLSPAPYRRG